MLHDAVNQLLLLFSTIFLKLLVVVTCTCLHLPYIVSKLTCLHLPYIVSKLTSCLFFNFLFSVKTVMAMRKLLCCGSSLLDDGHNFELFLEQELRQCCNHLPIE